MYFDISGRTNNHFLRHFVGHLNPRSVVVVDENDQRQEAFGGVIAQQNPNKGVYCPILGQSVRIYEDLKSLEVVIANDFEKRSDGSNAIISNSHGLQAKRTKLTLARLAFFIHSKQPFS